MKLLFWSLIGGLAGTALMDIAGIYSEKVKFTSGGEWGGTKALGRWVLSMFDGRFIHQNIIDSSPIKNEKSAGWVFHYLTGGSVALIYPVLYLASKVSVPEGHLIASLLFGLATSFLPWSILFPAFGWGFFGNRAPSGIRPLIATIIFHTIYGLGLGIVLNITS